jgi:multicomponent Na+:H+ antiporter subunit E
MAADMPNAQRRHSMFRHYGAMFLLLYGLWLLLSGHYTPLLLGFGALSCLFVVGIIYRMDVIDHEARIIRMGWRLLTYLPWLAWEIVKSNWDVAWRVMHPALPVSPTLFEITGSQQTVVGRVIFANSITLTPGTVTVDLEGDRFTVHAITRSGAEALMRGEMDRRVAAAETLEL